MKNILIVEDEVDLLKVYSLLFKMQKFKVYEASNGREGLKQLDKVKPDIIILDVLMPVMGGLEFLEKANLKERFPSTKVLVLSNLSDPDTLDRIGELGADKYMLKASVAPTELVAMVSQLLTD